MRLLRLGPHAVIKTMTILRLVASASFILSTAAMYTACSDSSSSTPSAQAGAPNLAGESSGGSPVANNSGGAAGQAEPGSDAGHANEGGASPVATEGGASTGGVGGASGLPNLPEGPCTYVTTGGATLPPEDPHFLCSAGSRVFQNGGEGEYSALFGGGFYLDGSNDSSTFACSLSSATPPAAGDQWQLSADHPGSCELSSQEGATTNLWKASTQPAMGDLTITFESATLTHGTADPSDVYYLCKIKLTGTLAGETGAADVDISGTFEVTLPFGA